jgi:hypothetical protein
VKKFTCLILVLVIALSVAGCQARSIGIIGGADGPTGIVVGKGKDLKRYRSEKEPVKAIMLDGSLYFETGEDSDVIGRCGTLDGSFKKTVDKWELPKNDNEANFELKSKDYCGFQHGFVKGTIEVPIGDDWEIFRKCETVQDISKYKYILKVEGEIPGNDDIEYIVLANKLDVTALEIAEADLSSANTEFLIIASDLD